MRGRKGVSVFVVSLVLAVSVASCGRYQIKIVESEKKEEAKSEAPPSERAEPAEPAKPAQEKAPEVVWEVVDPTQEKLKALEEKLKQLESKAVEPPKKEEEKKPETAQTTTTAPPSTTTATAPAVAVEKKPKGYVKLYEHSGFSGQSVSSGLGNSISSMHGMGFNDKASSVQYRIPEGWRVILHADTGFGGRSYPLTGSGAVSDLGSFGDKCSSLRWEGPR